MSTTNNTNDKDCDINVADQARNVVEHTLEECLGALQEQLEDLTGKQATASLQLRFLNTLQDELAGAIECVAASRAVVKQRLEKVRNAADLTVRS